MSKNYEKVKFYYEQQCWTKVMVKNAVIKEWITESEYEEITKEKYEQ